MTNLINQFNAFSTEIIKIKECYFLYSQLGILHKNDVEGKYQTVFEFSQYFLLYPLVILLYNFYHNIDKMKDGITDQNYIRIENILSLIENPVLKQKILESIKKKNIVQEYNKLKEYRNMEFAHIDKAKIENNFVEIQTIKYKLDINFKILIKFLDEIFEIITVEEFDKSFYNRIDDVKDEFKELVKVYNAANILRNKELERERSEFPQLTDGQIEMNIIKKYF